MKITTLDPNSRSVRTIGEYIVPASGDPDTPTCIPLYELLPIAEEEDMTPNTWLRTQNEQFADPIAALRAQENPLTAPVTPPSTGSIPIYQEVTADMTLAHTHKPTPAPPPAADAFIGFPPDPDDPDTARVADIRAESERVDDFAGWWEETSRYDAEEYILDREQHGTAYLDVMGAALLALTDSTNAKLSADQRRERGRLLTVAMDAQRAAAEITSTLAQGNDPTPSMTAQLVTSGMVLRRLQDNKGEL